MMKNKNIVIFGTSHGIGSAIANSLIESNQIYSYSRTQGVGTWSEWSHDQDLKVDHLPDVIDAVIYCPGTINLKPFHTIKDEDLRQEFEINYFAAVKVLKTLYPRLKKSSHASVVLFSTVAVSKGMNFHSSIAAAKGAIEGLVRALAMEWAPAIRVNAVAPSLVDTPLAQKLTSNASVLDATIQKHPLKRIGKVEDIAQAALFLIDDKNSWVTGQILHVDGGLSIC
jgi:NAD(P)-dependent dehydrogenase (short-subunit alcohol dehydrogenase family)